MEEKVDIKQEESDFEFRARLVDSLSQSFPDSALSKMLHQALDSDEEKDFLSSSCFSEIHLEKGLPDFDPLEEDDDLTSLAWLQDNDFLKNTLDVEELASSVIDGQKENKNEENIKKEVLPQSHPTHVPYNPQKHVNSKPPYSFSCLIFMAVEDSPQKRLPVKDIYNWILTHFPYYQNAPTGWKNSVRHNLSLNKCFKKVEKDRGQSIGKGSLWCIDPDYRPNLLQALRKTPYHPYHQLQMLANPQPQGQYTFSTVLPSYQRPLPLSPRANPNNTLSPHLFPFLSRRLAQSKLDLDSDIDVANTLVSLKGSHNASNPRLKPLSAWSNGRPGHRRHRSPSPPEFGSEQRKLKRLKRKFRSSSPAYKHKRRPESPIVITSSPSDDHSYSLASSPREVRSTSPASRTSSIDEEYDFGHHDDSGDDADLSDHYHSDMSDYEENYNSDCSEMDDGRSSRVRIGGSVSERKLQNGRRQISDEEDEAAKIVEGADALLNLAGIKTSNIVPLRSISPMVANSVKMEIAAS